MRWYPLVTFWQVTADVAVSNATPTGHGHQYGDFIRHWASIVPAPGWTDGDSDLLSAAVDR